jgi:serine/threonine-protein kinase
VSPTPAAAAWAPLGTDGNRGAGAGAGAGQYRRDEEPTQRPWVLWLLIGVAIAAIAGIAWLLTQGDPGGNDPELIPVPDVVGMTEQVARDTLAEAGLEFVRQTEPSIDVPEGSVTKTDPPADEEVPADSKVSVWISSGADAVLVPEMKNFTREQAQAELIGLGFDAANIDWQTEDSPDVLKDSVTRTEPPAGDSVDPTGTIGVFLSTGLVTLPDLTGKPEQQARDELTALLLVPIITREDSTTVAEGAVIRQSRSPGPVEQRASIEIVIAQAPVIEMTTVPGDLVGMTCKQALDSLGTAELNGECESPDGTRADNNDIVSSSNPAPGTEVPVGSAVTLVAEPLLPAP